MTRAAAPDTRHPARETKRLHGWKQIAVHLGRGVRTVQRWERDLGLPVHRLITKGSEVVYAVPDELDTWWEQTNRSRPPRPAPTREAPPSLAHPRRAVTRDDFALAVLAVAVLLVGLAGLPDGWFRRVWPASGRGSASSQPVSWRFDHQLLQVSDAQGNPLWERAFEFPIDEAVYRSGHPADGHAPSVVIDDIDGKGDTEVLLVPWAYAAGDRRLWCFRANGTLAFTAPASGGLVRQAPGRDAEFNAGRFTVSVDPDRRTSIWLSAPHWSLPRTIVQRLDDGGRLRAEYASRGSVSVLKALTVNGRRMLLVGGTSAASQTASLALLDYDDPAGSDPITATGGPACEGCDPRPPLAYLLFPRLDVAAAVSRQPTVDIVQTRNDGGLVVSVLQARIGVTGDRPFTHAAVVYEFSPDLRMESAMATDQYLLAHSELYLGNRLTHPFDVADQRSLLDVRAWQGGRLVRLLVGGRIPLVR